MKVTQLDLDGAGSPFQIVRKILSVEKDLQIPIPIEELSRQLGIDEIKDLSTEGFVGGLIADAAKSIGSILVQKDIGHQRRRFTIGHELGHFLIPFHKPVKPEGFFCSRADMLKWPSREQKQSFRMEAEANEFSSLILMPPPHLRAFIDQTGDPNLDVVNEIHDHFDVSKDAAARAYASYHNETIAIVVAKDGRLLRTYKNKSFPWLCIHPNGALPSHVFNQAINRKTGTPGRLKQIGAEHWLETENGTRSPNLYEQIFLQSKGFAMILLWAEIFESDYDPEENQTAKQRYRNRQAKWH